MSGLERIASFLADDDDRAGRVPNHTFSGAAEQGPAQSGPTVSGKHDEIGLAGFGGVGDFVERSAKPNQAFFQQHGWDPGRCDDEVEFLPGGFHETVILQGEREGSAEIGGGDGLDNVEEGEPGADALCEGERVVQRRLGAFRKIQRDENRFQG